MIDELDPAIDGMRNCQIGQELVETHEEESQEEIQGELEKLSDSAVPDSHSSKYFPHLLIVTH